MSIRTRHRWLAWLLPLMLLRAFMPVGFMVSWSEAGPSIVMCSGMGPVPAQAAGIQGDESRDHHAHAHHQHGGEVPDGQPSGNDHRHSQAHDASMCPFAVAGPAHASLQAQALADPALRSVHEIAFYSDPELRSATVFIDRIRGPPSV